MAKRSDIIFEKKWKPKIETVPKPVGGKADDILRKYGVRGTETPLNKETSYEAGRDQGTGDGGTVDGILKKYGVTGDAQTEKSGAVDSILKKYGVEESSQKEIRPSVKTGLQLSKIKSRTKDIAGILEKYGLEKKMAIEQPYATEAASTTQTRRWERSDSLSKPKVDVLKKPWSAAELGEQKTTAETELAEIQKQMGMLSIDQENLAYDAEESEKQELILQMNELRRQMEQKQDEVKELQRRYSTAEEQERLAEISQVSSEEWKDRYSTAEAELAEIKKQMGMLSIAQESLAYDAEESEKQELILQMNELRRQMEQKQAEMEDLDKRYQTAENMEKEAAYSKLSAAEIKDRHSAATEELAGIKRQMGMLSIDQENLAYDAEESEKGDLTLQLNELQKQWGQKQSEVNELAAQYYKRDRAEQMEKLWGSADLTEAYAEAQKVDEDLKKVLYVLNGDSASDSKVEEYSAEMKEKYHTNDLLALSAQLTAEKKQWAELLSGGEVNYENMVEYADRLKREEEYRREQRKSQRFADDHPFWASLSTIPANSVQGFEYFDTVLKGMGHSDATNLDSYVPADVYDMHATNFVRTVRGTVAEALASDPRLQSEIGGQNAYAFLYQTAMSMGDFTFNALITGNFTGGLGGAGSEAAKKAASNLSLAIMGSGAASNATVDAIERGLSNRQAYTLGIIAGFAEIITEKFSLDALLEGKWEEGAVKYVLKNSAVEGSEEVGSSLINLVGDVLVARDKSQWRQDIARYENLGYSTGESFGLAVADQAESMGLDALGGFLSGGFMAGSNVTINKVVNSYYVEGRVTNSMAEQILEDAEAVEALGVTLTEDMTQEQKRTAVKKALESTVQGEKTASHEGDGEIQYMLKQVAEGETVKAYEGKDLSKDGSVYSYEFLTSLPDMTVTTLPEVGTIQGKDGRINARTAVNLGMANARKVGVEKDGKVLIRNGYTGKQLLVTSDSIRHGLNGKFNRLLTNARLGSVIGDLVRNAVPVNALQNKAEGVTGTYAMAGYATDSKGRELVAIITVEQYSGNVAGLEVYDVTHAVSGRQKNGSQASTKLQGFYPIKATTISIADLLETVKSTHQSILSEDVLSRLGEKRDPKGDYTDKVLFSIKDADVAWEQNIDPELIGQRRRMLTQATDIYGENGQKAIQAVYDGREDIGPYYAGFSNYYDAGVAGIELEKVDSQYAGSLTKAQKYAAYASGQNDAAASLAERKQAAEFASVAGKDAGLVYDDYVRENVDKKDFRRLNAVCKALGVRARFSGEVVENAQINIEEDWGGGNEILLSRNMDDALRVVIGHEWTHRIEQLAPEAYRSFRDSMAETLGSEELARRTDRMFEEYQKRGMDKDYEYILDEVAADYAGELLRDGKLMDRFIESHKEDRTLLQNMWEAIRKLIAKLTGKTQEEQQLKGQLSEVEQKLMDAMETAETQAKKLSEQAGGKKTAAAKGGDRRFSFAEKHIPTYEELIQKKDITVVDIRGERTGRIADQRKAFLKSKKAAELCAAPVENHDTKESMFIIPKSFTHCFYNLGMDQIGIVEHLREIVEEAILTHKETSRYAPDDKTTGVYTFFGAVRTEKGIQPLKLKVKEYYIDGQTLPKEVSNYLRAGPLPETYAGVYDGKVLVIEEIEKEEASSNVQSTVGKTTADKYPSASSGNILTDGKDDVKEERKTIPVRELLEMIKGAAEKYIPKASTRFSLKDADDPENLAAFQKKNEWLKYRYCDEFLATHPEADPETVERLVDIAWDMAAGEAGIPEWMDKAIEKLMSQDEPAPGSLEDIDVPEAPQAPSVRAGTDLADDAMADELLREWSSAKFLARKGGLKLNKKMTQEQKRAAVKEAIARIVNKSKDVTSSGPLEERSQTQADPTIETVEENIQQTERKKSDLRQMEQMEKTIEIGTVDFSDKQALLKELDKAEKETAGLDYEVNYTVTPDGKVWRVLGDEGIVDPSEIPGSLEGSYSYHNHPAKKTWYSFSASDVAFFIGSGEAYARASDDLYEYVMQRTPETLALSPDEVYHRFSEILNTSVFEMQWNGLINPDLDSFHEVMKKLSQELKFKYERREKNQ